MNLRNDDYRVTRRQTLSDVRRRRARRNKIRRMIPIMAIVGVLAVAVILIVLGINDDETVDNKPTTAGSIMANATEDTTSANQGEQTTREDDTTQKDTTQENTTPEATTPPPVIYKEEFYTDGEFVVCIDAGHGGNDTGCVGVDGRYEKDDVLMLSMLIVKELESRGVKVITTRNVDKWVDLADRPLFANEHNADVLVSVHRNSLDNDTVTKGFEAWIHSEATDNSQSLASLIMGNLEKVGISRNRGVRKGTQGSSKQNYKVNSASTMPSVLLEMGFMSSPKDNQLYKNNAKEYAKAIADAIIQWSANKPY